MSLANEKQTQYASEGENVSDKEIYRFEPSEKQRNRRDGKHRYRQKVRYKRKNDGSRIKTFLPFFPQNNRLYGRYQRNRPTQTLARFHGTTG